MNTDQLIKRMQPAWEELRQLVERVRRGGPRALTPDELARLDRLYRVTTVHMAQVRSRVRNQTLLKNLNHLVAQAHSVIYVAPSRQPLRRIVGFYFTGFARAVVRTGRFHFASFLLLALGIACGSLIAVQRPEGTYALFGPGEFRLPGSSPEQLQKWLEAGRDIGGGEKFAFASFLLTHNIKVGFTACAGGIVGGVPTVFLMIFNGAMLGAFLTVYVEQGLAADVFAWILPHGITELGAVILCGGAGLMLGMAVIRPGLDTRRKALLQTGREAVALLLGVIPMFVMAGLIESYLRQSHLDTSSRLLFALGTVVFWLVCFVHGYHRERRAENDETSFEEAPIRDGSVL